MKVLEQGMITSVSDIARLGIVDWNRLNGYWSNDATAPMIILERWIVGHAKYTLMEWDLTQYPEAPGWPDWHHAGSGWHEHIGRLYWNMFHHRKMGAITFADSPDFQGTLQIGKMEQPIAFYGDIGEVSASTFVFTLMRMNAGELWISLVSEKQHIIIEVLANVQQVFSSVLSDQLGLKKLLTKHHLSSSSLQELLPVPSQEEQEAK